ncbi:ankyrin repeat-containing protein [Anaeramoeba ignava]|uniref:Ankyrin repeat-containing protein n=1 Tax=Anaeramoeba ignava TaxID=1746090 RepID=A0A9Q0LDC6_ANAIG|nr:ankyrin repeat-containing protein [Anaeramoeba ignava]
MVLIGKDFSIEIIEYLIKQVLIEMDIKVQGIVLNSNQNNNENNKNETNIINTLTDSQNRNILHLLFLNKTYQNHFFQISKYLLQLSPSFIIQQDNSGSSPFHYLCRYSTDVKLIEFLIKKGANPSQTNKKLDTPLHNLCSSKNNTFFAIKYLLKNHKIQIDAKNYKNQTPLHLLCQNNQNEKILKLLIKHGANTQNIDSFKNTPLHYCCLRKPSLDFIKIIIQTKPEISPQNSEKKSPLYYLLLSKSTGESADFLLENGAIEELYNFSDGFIIKIFRTFNSCLIDLFVNWGFDIEPFMKRKNSQFIQKYRQIFSICEDFIKLFRRQELTDYEIKCIDGTISVHKIILLSRIKEIGIENFTFHLSKLEKKEANEILMFVYSGLIKKNYVKLVDFFAKMGIKKELFWKKIGRKGLLFDFKRLFEDEESKDFEIILENSQIKAHKTILIARSELFRGMFNSVQDDSNQVHDYSGFSSDTIEVLIKFIYLDEIEESLDDLVLNELFDSCEYFQLNRYSKIHGELFEQKQK